HVRNFVGALSLADTAALLSQCSALVANDSGMMHLGAALGVPTLGIFGITSTTREHSRAPTLFPITKGLPCEPACREDAWGRQDCEHHLRCLKTLTAPEVLTRLEAITGPRPARKPIPRITQEVRVQKLGLAYHGHVFDTSGYGNAARAYIHALHEAGI